MNHGKNTTLDAKAIREDSLLRGVASYSSISSFSISLIVGVWTIMKVVMWISWTVEY